MNGGKLRERLAKGEAITMLTPHHASSGLSVRLVELGADAIFLDCEHGTWSFEDVRLTAQAIRGAGGAAIVRPHSHERPILIRYLNAGADGLMVPMVDTADQARAIVDAVRYACPADHEKRLIITMIETLGAIDNCSRSKGSTSSSLVPATCRRTWAIRRLRRSASHDRKLSQRRWILRSGRFARPGRSPARS
jgi:hypothetical protein